MMGSHFSVTSSNYYLYDYIHTNQWETISVLHLVTITYTTIHSVITAVL
jgi:hypothetical protein